MPDFDPAHVNRGGPPHRYPDGPLEVTKLHVGPYENNAYLLRDPETNDALLVDAANEPERLLEFGAARPSLRAFRRCAPTWTYSESRVLCLVPRTHAAAGDVGE